MYLLRRVCRTKPGKARDVAASLDKICAAYEKNGRAKATIYVGEWAATPTWPTSSGLSP